MQLRGPSTVLVPLLFLLSLALVASCKQGEGERCQLDDDCEDGLVCCVDISQGSAMRVVGGVCWPNKDTCMQAEPDIGTTDAAKHDAKPDGKADTSTTDGPPVDSAGHDTTHPDTSTPDLAPDLPPPSDGPGPE